MSWETEGKTIVRYLINDIDASNYTFTDAQVKTSLVIAAQFVSQEIDDFVNTYTIDLTLETISPDPESSFLNLISLYSACILMNGIVKSQSLSSIKVIDGPSTIDMTKSADSVKSLHKDLCKRYEQAKLEFNINGKVGQAILSPYSPALWSRERR